MDHVSFRWFFETNLLLSISLSAVSLIITSVYYNRQLELPAAKFVSAVLVTVFTTCFRVFVFSILFSSIPLAALGIIIVTYVVNLSVYKVLGESEEKWSFVVYSYYSIFTPTGYATTLGNIQSTKSTASVGISELERIKLNQESLLERVKVSYLVNVVLSFGMLLAYLVLVEYLIFLIRYG